MGIYGGKFVLGADNSEEVIRTRRPGRAARPPYGLAGGPTRNALLGPPPKYSAADYVEAARRSRQTGANRPTQYSPADYAWGAEMAQQNAGAGMTPPPLPNDGLIHNAEQRAAWVAAERKRRGLDEGGQSKLVDIIPPQEMYAPDYGSSASGMQQLAQAPQSPQPASWDELPEEEKASELQRRRDYEAGRGGRFQDGTPYRYGYGPNGNLLDPASAAMQHSSMGFGIPAQDLMVPHLNAWKGQAAQPTPSAAPSPAQPSSTLDFINNLPPGPSAAQPTAPKPMGEFGKYGGTSAGGYPVSYTDFYDAPDNALDALRRRQEQEQRVATTGEDVASAQTEPTLPPARSRNMMISNRPVDYRTGGLTPYQSAMLSGIRGAMGALGITQPTDPNEPLTPTAGDVAMTRPTPETEQRIEERVGALNATQFGTRPAPFGAAARAGAYDAVIDKGFRTGPRVGTEVDPNGEGLLPYNSAERARAKAAYLERQDAAEQARRAQMDAEYERKKQLARSKYHEVMRRGKAEGRAFAQNYNEKTGEKTPYPIDQQRQRVVEADKMTPEQFAAKYPQVDRADVEEMAPDQFAAKYPGVNQAEVKSMTPEQFAEKYPVVNRNEYLPGGERHLTIPAAANVKVGEDGTVTGLTPAKSYYDADFYAGRKRAIAETRATRREERLKQREELRNQYQSRFQQPTQAEQATDTETETVPTEYGKATLGQLKDNNPKEWMNIYNATEKQLKSNPDYAGSEITPQAVMKAMPNYYYELFPNIDPR
jgi:hypothetical protein